MKDNEKVPPQIRERIEEVKTDNAGRPQEGDVTCKEIVEEVKRVNPDANTLDRG